MLYFFLGCLVWYGRRLLDLCGFSVRKTEAETCCGGYFLKPDLVHARALEYVLYRRCRLVKVKERTPRASDSPHMLIELVIRGFVGILFPFLFLSLRLIMSFVEDFVLSSTHIPGAAVFCELLGHRNVGSEFGQRRHNRYPCADSRYLLQRGYCC